MFYDQLGQPLDEGYIYVGEVNKDPRQFPINVYLDVAKTNLAVQPLRTINGVLSNGYKPIPVFTDAENYSVLVLDKNQAQVFYDKSSVTSNFGVTGALEYIQELTDTAREEILNQGFVARVYSTPSEGVAAGTGVPNGKYFNARSSDPAIYAVEYLNNNGTAQATGKTYPTLQAWTDALAAVTTTGDNKLAAINTLASQKTTDITATATTKTADVNAAGEQKKAQLSEIAAAVSGLNAGQEFFQTETALKATTPSVAGKVAKALDTKKVWYWDGSAWVDTGLSELDQANANAMQKPGLLGATNLNTLNTVAGLYLQNNYTSFDLSAANYPVLSNGMLQVYKNSASSYVIQFFTAQSNSKTYMRAYTGTWSAWVMKEDYETYLATQLAAQPFLKYATASLTSTADLNTVITPGIYFQTNSSYATSALNYPVTLAGELRVEAIGIYVFQEYRAYTTNIVYRRPLNIDTCKCCG